MEKKLLYLGYFSEPELFSELMRHDEDISVAAYKFETQLLKNLIGHREKYGLQIRIISCLSYNEAIGQRPEMGSYMGTTLDYVWKRRGTIKPDPASIRRIHTLVQGWLKETEGCERIVLTYATNPLLLFPFLFKNQHVKIITICSEVPQYRLNTGGSLVKKVKKSLGKFINEKMDGYIFLSHHMNEVANPNNRPWITVEGLPEVFVQPQDINTDYTRRENIFYAGYLIPENGIDTLLDAFILLDREDVDLTLCGTGSCVDKIRKLACDHPNIHYLGSIPNEQVMQLEREATLLINPRKSDSLLTRYSFPSKTFEYLLSGTPAIITRLDGIGEEYYRYCYTCDSSSVQCLQNDLEAALQIPLQQRCLLARSAYEFIVREKSSPAQVDRIASFLLELMDR